MRSFERDIHPFFQSIDTAHSKYTENHGLMHLHISS